mmetsp:Transcript_59243/g.171181  ORF Transcript_59243/g.171181 Transcript_59243/m.171181 type:complete len:407 (-) Transcript_59243:172-1392(-)
MCASMRSPCSPRKTWSTSSGTCAAFLPAPTLSPWATWWNLKSRSARWNRIARRVPVTSMSARSHSARQADRCSSSISAIIGGAVVMNDKICPSLRPKVPHFNARRGRAVFSPVKPVMTTTFSTVYLEPALGLEIMKSKAQLSLRRCPQCRAAFSTLVVMEPTAECKMTWTSPRPSSLTMRCQAVTVTVLFLSSMYVALMTACNSSTDGASLSLKPGGICSKRKLDRMQISGMLRFPCSRTTTESSVAAWPARARLAKRLVLMRTRRPSLSTASTAWFTSPMPTSNEWQYISTLAKLQISCGPALPDLKRGSSGVQSGQATVSLPREQTQTGSAEASSFRHAHAGCPKAPAVGLLTAVSVARSSAEGWEPSRCLNSPGGGNNHTQAHHNFDVKTVCNQANCLAEGLS